MGAAYNFCDCKNTDPRSEEKLPTLSHNQYLNLNNPSMISKKNSLLESKNKTSKDIIEDIKRKMLLI